MPKTKEKELKTPNISRFSAPFEVSYQYLFFLLRMYLYNTRNQVVAQAARGFESHPVRQRKTGESNGFIGFYLFTDIHLYLISSHDSKSISLIYYP